MENFDRFMTAWNLAKATNNAEQAELAIDLLRQARADGRSWANAYRIVPTPKAAPCDKIKLKNFLNPYTQDVRSWSSDDVRRDYLLRKSCGAPVPKNLLNPFVYTNEFDRRKAYVSFLRHIMPQPDRISGVYMMFQRDMKYGHCVKIGSSDDCAARQNRYITCNPFAIKGPMKAVDNPHEVEKECHAILAEHFDNVETSREWFAIDHATYKKMKTEGFDFFKGE